MKIILIIISMALVNYNNLLNPKYQEFFQCTNEEVLLRGASGAGKSYAIADKLLLQSVWQPNVPIEIRVLRKTFPALRGTALDILEKRARALGLPWDMNKSEWIARSRNLTFRFLSLNNKEDYNKLKSITDVDFFWLNELLEFTENDYDECLRRMRGGESSYPQMISDFNPYDKYSWVHKRFYEDCFGDIKKFHYTVYDNHPEYLKTKKATKYIEKLSRYKDRNPNAYNVYFLGEWGALEGMIFNWDVQSPPEDVSFDGRLYGGDFGYSVDEAALVDIYRKSDEYWLEEKLYKTGLTNQQLAKTMIERPDIDHKRKSWWDSAEPKSIEEMALEDINAHGAIKGPDSVRAGIDFMLGCKIHMVPGSDNLIMEHNCHVWDKDRNGKSLNVPADGSDHLMSASRYGIYSDHKIKEQIPFMFRVRQNEATV